MPACFLGKHPWRTSIYSCPLPLPPAPLPLPQTLVSVSTIGTRDELSEEQLVDAVKSELGAWFGRGSVAGWQHLRTYRIPFAQPNQVGFGGAGGELGGEQRVGDGWRTQGGMQGLAAGRCQCLAGMLLRAPPPHDAPSPGAAQVPPTDLSRPVSLGGGLYVCGDHRHTATLDGALQSGRLAAEAVMADLK